MNSLENSASVETPAPELDPAPLASSAAREASGAGEIPTPGENTVSGKVDVPDETAVIGDPSPVSGVTASEANLGAGERAVPGTTAAVRADVLSHEIGIAVPGQRVRGERVEPGDDAADLGKRSARGGNSAIAEGPVPGEHAVLASGVAGMSGPVAARSQATNGRKSAGQVLLQELRSVRVGGVSRNLVVYGGAILAALIVGLLLVIGGGAAPVTAANALWEGMFGTPYAFGSALNAAAVLALIATGFTIAHRAGLVNVGGEGQLALGGIAATAVGVHLPSGMPAVVSVPLIVVAGFLAGAAWAGIAAWLRVRRGTSEVITTLLLNFVGLGLVTLVVHEAGLLRQPVTSVETLPQSAPLAAGARLPLLGIEGSPATIAVLVAAIVVVVTAIILRRTAIGTRLTAVGLSEAAAARLGVPVARLRFGALAVAGGLAGVAGAALVATVPFVLAENFTSGYGFAGLVVGLLARGSLTAVAGIALAFGLLASGGINLQLAASVPASSIQVVQSVLIIFVAGAVTLRKAARR